MNALIAFRLFFLDAASRSRAISRLTSDWWLTRVALWDPSWMVATEAVKRIRRQSFLARVVFGSPRAGHPLRLTAIDRMDDLALLRKVAESNILQSEAAIERISHEETLAELAKAGHHANLIVPRISDPDFLTGIALAGTCSDHRMIPAVKGIRDQSCLARIAAASTSKEVGEVALDLINDDQQALLASVAVSETSKVGWAAAARVIDPEGLGRIARRAATNLRAHVIERVNDQSLLQELTQPAEPEKVREAATRRILDEEVLKRISTSDNSWWVRIVAIAGLSDEAFLQQIDATAPFEIVHIPEHQSEGGFGHVDEEYRVYSPVRRAAKARMLELNIPLDRSCIRLLKLQSDKLKAAGATHDLFAWSPLVSIGTETDVTEAAVSVCGTDWKALAQGIQSADPIALRSLSKEALTHREGGGHPDPKTGEFWLNLSNLYLTQSDRK